MQVNDIQGVLCIDILKWMRKISWKKIHEKKMIWNDIFNLSKNEIPLFLN